jgi:hypothetical protein
MRFRPAALIGFVVTLAAAAPAAAAAPVEEQLSADHSYVIDAVDGWVSWLSDMYGANGTGEEWKLWHAGAIVPVAQVSGRALGTDAKGRAVALDAPCSACRAVQRRLPDGPVNALPRRVVHSVDEADGTLAYTRRDGRIYVLRRGARRVQRLSPVNVRQVVLGGRWLLYVSGNPGGVTEFGALDLTHPKRRPRTLVHDDDFEEDCRCTDSSTGEYSPAVDGHFAYWVEATSPGPYASYPLSESTKILRVDLAAKRPEVESFVPQRTVQAVTASHGTIFYSSRGSAEETGVWAVAAPVWQSTSLRLPVQG